MEKSEILLRVVAPPPLARRLLDAGYKVAGLDQSGALCERAANGQILTGLSECPEFRFIEADIREAGVEPRILFSPYFFAGL